MRMGLYALNRMTGGELMSDDATFWTSLLVPLILKAAHSMGWISIFGIHDRVNDPVPHMLVGQIVAAVVLSGFHYLGRREIIRKELDIDANTINNERINDAVESLAIESVFQDYDE